MPLAAGARWDETLNIYLQPYTWYNVSRTRTEGEHAMQKRSRRQYESEQAEANKQKLALARDLVGKQVVIEGVPRKVTGYSEVTGEAEIRIGLKTKAYDPRTLYTVERA
jgi:hypothetical protein